MEHRILSLSNSVDIVAVNMVVIRHLGARAALEGRHAAPAVDSSEPLLLVQITNSHRSNNAVHHATRLCSSCCLSAILIMCLASYPWIRKPTGLHDCGANTKEENACGLRIFATRELFATVREWGGVTSHHSPALLSTILQSASSDLRTSGQSST